MIKVKRKKKQQKNKAWDIILCSAETRFVGWALIQYIKSLSQK